MAIPHQLPFISQRSERQARRIRIKLTSGIIIPIDFNASVVHILHRKRPVDRMLDRPSTARPAASAAACGGESLAAHDES
jgi:hypothetical protein